MRASIEAVCSAMHRVLRDALPANHAAAPIMPPVAANAPVLMPARRA
jgi:hypothetical protein